jgi:hypothetical protein
MFTVGGCSMLRGFVCNSMNSSWTFDDLSDPADVASSGNGLAFSVSSAEHGLVRVPHSVTFNPSAGCHRCWLNDGTAVESSNPYQAHCTGITWLEDIGLVICLKSFIRLDTI